MCPKVRHILVTYLLIKFINKILENWYNEGLLTREKIDEASGARAEKKVSEETHSYDLEDYKSLVNNFGKG